MSDDYEVGYKRPPKEHRFKKGKSGNPNGRPRRQPQPPKPDESPAELLKRVSAKKIDVHGEQRSLMEMEFHALQVKAAKGDVSASRHLSSIRRELGLLNPQPAALGGVLVVPGPMDEADFEKLAFKQQAQFRVNSESLASKRSEPDPET